MNTDRLLDCSQLLAPFGIIPGMKKTKMLMTAALSLALALVFAALTPAASGAVKRTRPIRRVWQRTPSRITMRPPRAREIRACASAFSTEAV